MVNDSWLKSSHHYKRDESIDTATCECGADALFKSTIFSNGKVREVFECECGLIFTEKTVEKLREARHA